MLQKKKQEGNMLVANWFGFFSLIMFLLKPLCWILTNAGIDRDGKQSEFYLWREDTEIKIIEIEKNKDQIKIDIDKMKDEIKTETTCVVEIPEAKNIQVPEKDRLFFLI